MKRITNVVHKRFGIHLLKAIIKFYKKDFNDLHASFVGSRKQTSSILLKLGEVREVEDELNAKRQKLQQLEAELASVRKAKER